MKNRPQTQRVAVEVIANTVAPLVIAAGLVVLLTDALINRVDPAELRLNTLLMGTMPFRVLSDRDSFLVAVGSSLILLVFAMLLAIGVGVGGGVGYAWSRGRPLKAAAWGLATLGASLPTFFWAVLADLLVLALFLRTGVRVLPTAGFGLDEHLVLPVFALAVRPAAYIFRLTATAVEDVRNADYVRTALAKGLNGRQLLHRHVLPNAAPTVIAAVVLATRGALSSLVIVEFVYVWGGAGLTFVQAIGARQAGLAVGLALTFTVVSALLTLGAGLSQRRVPT